MKRDAPERSESRSIPRADLYSYESRELVSKAMVTSMESFRFIASTSASESTPQYTHFAHAKCIYFIPRYRDQASACASDLLSRTDCNRTFQLRVLAVTSRANGLHEVFEKTSNSMSAPYPTIQTQLQSNMADSRRQEAEESLARDPYILQHLLPLMRGMKGLWASRDGADLRIKCGTSE